MAAIALLPIAGFTQTNQVPPVPPVPPVAPVPPSRDKEKDKDRGPKVPITWLGVETSTVPRVLSEQLNLPKGFGLVVDYVVPDGPAAAAGLLQNDILKMFNDQILMEPDQLAKLVRSQQDGATVTLTVLRKMAEQKITVKLGKKEVRQREHDFGFNFNNEDFNEKMQAFNDKMKDFNEKMKDFKFDFQTPDFGPDIRETVRASAEARAHAREEVQRVREEAQRNREQAQRNREEAQRAREEAQRSSREMRLFSRDKGSMKSTTIDLGKATIVFTDEKGEMKLETVDGKKILTVKDPQGKLVFSGPVDSEEDVNKLPANVRERYDNLEHKNLPTINPSTFVDNEDMENDNDNDNDNGDDNDSENDDVNVNASGDSVQISCPGAPRFARNVNLLSV
jgi:serine protease Do